MADTEALWNTLKAKTNAEAWALVPNLKGLERAITVGGLKGVSYPLSVSEQFQIRNTKRGLADAWPLVAQLAQQTKTAGLDFEVYLSMAFGNSYGEPWKPTLTIEALDRLAGLNVTRVGLADTIGCAKPDDISLIVTQALHLSPVTWIGVHLHGRPDTWSSRVVAALGAGCRRFDAATGSLGGCPFAQDQLVSNIPTEGLVTLLESRGMKTGYDTDKLAACVKSAQQIRARYA
jgi:hydroxymethylglutaryl-CoA lyase